MISWNTEEEARNEIKILVSHYYKNFVEKDKDFVPGDRINYAFSQSDLTFAPLLIKNRLSQN